MANKMSNYDPYDHLQKLQRQADHNALILTQLIEQFNNLVTLMREQQDEIYYILRKIEEDQ